MTAYLSRRTFLGSLAITAAGIGATTARTFAADVPPPKEGGLSSEGLLVGQSGFHTRTAAPLPFAEVSGFLSSAQLTAHHADYVKTVGTLGAAELSLMSAARDPNNTTAYAELRRQQVASANAVLLHDFYFGGIASAKVEVPSYIRRNMNEHMGSLESWAADFTTCALTAKAWAALVYDPYDDRWHNVVMDSDMDGVWIGGNPLVVCDVATHAYANDYKRREDYVAKFFDHIDWDTVAKRYHRVDRM